MNDQFSDYGLWWLVAINSLIFIVFVFSFFRPQSPRDWRSFGVFSAFLVALFTEMYGFPLTIYLLSGWLTSKYPGVDWFAHDSGHLLEMLFGRGGDPHFGPFHLLSSIFVFGGFILLAAAWRVLYRARLARKVATTGAYSLMRHPQYAAFISIMLGFLLQWPTLPTLVMFPILVFMYVKLARREEREALGGPGEAYRSYMYRTPFLFPTIRNSLRLAVVTAFILTLPTVIAFVVALGRDPAADTPLSGDGGNRVEASTPIGKDMDGRRGLVDTLKKQMQSLTKTTEPALRRDLVLAHLDAIRQISATLHGMNLKMIEDVDKGRIVSDPGLKQRLQLNADFMYMQLQMLEAATNSGDERRPVIVIDKARAPK